MLLLPDPISRLPIPRYFENMLWLRTGRTRIPRPSLSNNRAVPRTHAQDTPHLTGNSDLPFAGDPRLLLHCDLLFPYFSTCSLLQKPDLCNPSSFPRVENCPESASALGACGVESRPSRSRNQSACGCVYTSLCNQGAQTGVSVSCSAQETNANDEGRIGRRLARAKTEYKWRIGSVAHAFILGEHKANVNSQDHLSVWPVRSQSTDVPNSLLMASSTAAPGSFSPCSSADR